MAPLNRTVLAAWKRRASNEFGRLLAGTDGQDVIEYALLTAFIGFAGAAAFIAMRGSLGGAYIDFTGGVWNDWDPPNPMGGGS